MRTPKVDGLIRVQVEYGHEVEEMAVGGLMVLYLCVSDDENIKLATMTRLFLKLFSTLSLAD